MADLKPGDGWSQEARRSASRARSIKTLLGPGPYKLYKETGQFDAGALARAREGKEPTPSPQTPLQRAELAHSRHPSLITARKIEEVQKANSPAHPHEVKLPVSVYRKLNDSDFLRDSPAEGLPEQWKAAQPGRRMTLHLNDQQFDELRDAVQLYAGTERGMIGVADGIDHNFIKQAEAWLNDNPPRPGVQADTKPTPPSEVHEPSEFLRSLSAGDIVRGSDDQRYRVQKVVEDGSGLRIHDTLNGARNLTWGQLEALGLYKPEVKGGGPAAQRIGELRDEARGLGIDVTYLTSKKDLILAISKRKAADADALDQIDPQLASDAKELQDFSADQPWRSPQLFREFWNNDNWDAEEKLDGVRLKLHLTPEGIRADSRRRDSATRRFSEKSQNFNHLLLMRIPGLEGTVLDSEGMIPAESGVLPSGVRFHGALSVSTAATNAGPATSRQIQSKFGPMQFWLFDILRDRGEDLTGLPQSERRKRLEKLYQQIIEAYPQAAEFLHVTKQASGDDKLPFFESLIKGGGEGIIFKHRDRKYLEGKRSKSWMKLKKFQEVDGFVTGWKPGKAGNEGLVGAVEVSVRINGKVIPVAWVSQFTEQEQKAMTAPDGSLKKEYLNKVLTFRGQELTKNGRFRHAVHVIWREDKSADDIDGYEIRKDLQALGIVPEDSKQESVL